MKKKLFIFLFAIVAVFACALGFAGCDLFDTADNTDGDSSDHVHTMTKVSAKEATCTEAGNIEYWRCNLCKYYFTDSAGEHETTANDVAIPKKGHAEVIDAAVTATCTKSGKTEGKHCFICNTVIVAQQTIPAGHTEIVIKGYEATCYSGGKTDGKKCTVCNTITVPQRTIPSSHKEVIDEAVAATCTTDGKTEGKHCSVCNEVIIAQQTIPAGHTEVTDAKVEATCTTDGKTQGLHCSVCNTVIVAQQTIPARHTEVTDAAVEVTCTTDGKTEGKHCSVCNTVIVAQQIIPSSGHNRVTDAAVEATCAQAGKTAGEHCSVCNYVFIAQHEIAKTPHSGSGKLCTVCGGLTVAASTGLTFKELTSLPYGTSTYASTDEIIGYEVSGYQGNVFVATDLVIPETHNGKPVLGIGFQAFYQCYLVTITIPSSVVYIGVEAFAYNVNLRDVTIADSVTTIGISAFRGACNAMVSFKCPANLTKVPDKLFTYNLLLTNVIIGGNVTEVSLAAFTDCTALKDIYFEGTEERWNQVERSWSNVNPTISFYSETEPTGAGNYWHYDASGNPVKW